jgi:hypothetical protein
MSTHPYTEDQLGEQRAIGVFAELGWQTVSALEEDARGDLKPGNWIDGKYRVRRRFGGEGKSGIGGGLSCRAPKVR